MFSLGLFILLSILFNRSMFVSEIDGFYYQVQSVANNEDLGSLAFMHKVRYAISYPFYISSSFNIPSLIENIFLIIYLSPILFFIKLPLYLKKISILLLILSIFFSYRTILVMSSIYILIIHIKFTNVKYRYIIISFIYSFLSSGTLLIWIFIFSVYKNKFITNIKMLQYINIFIFFVIIIMVGPVSHKLLFFIDPIIFGSADAVTLDAIFNITLNDIGKLIINVLERSLINESFEIHDYTRITILIFELSILLFLLLVYNDKLILIIFFLFLFSILFEGLMAYSLFFIVFILFYDYMYKELIKVIYEKNTIK